MRREKFMNILIVDDEIAVTSLLKRELSDCCAELNIICVNSGYEALNQIMTRKIHLLLTDLAMPDMNGYELFSRSQEYDPEMPIIMMTGFGYDPNHIVVKSKQEGLTDVVFKPFNMEKLLTLIKSKLGL